VGIIIISPGRITMEISLRLRFPATNNEAKYEALFARMAMVSNLGGKVIEFFFKFKVRGWAS